MLDYGSAFSKKQEIIDDNYRCEANILVLD